MGQTCAPPFSPLSSPGKPVLPWPSVAFERSSSSPRSIEPGAVDAKEESLAPEALPFPDVVAEKAVAPSKSMMVSSPRSARFSLVTSKASCTEARPSFVPPPPPQHRRVMVSNACMAATRTSSERVCLWRTFVCRRYQYTIRPSALFRGRDTRDVHSGFFTGFMPTTAEAADCPPPDLPAVKLHPNNNTVR